MVNVECFSHSSVGMKTFYLQFLPIRLLHRPALRGQRKQDSQTQFAAGGKNTQHSAFKVKVAKTKLLVLRVKLA